MLSKEDRLQVNAQAGDDEICNAMRELALYGIKRGKKAAKGCFSAQSARRDINSICKHLQAISKSGENMPFAVYSLMENHYIISKTATSLRDTVKQLQRERFRVTASGKHKGQVRIYSICKELLEMRNYSLDYGVLGKSLETFSQISPLDECELTLLPLMLKMVCIERATMLYRDIEEVANECNAAERIYEKLCECVSPKRSELILDEAARTLNYSGHTRLWTLLSENDQFAHIDVMKKKLAHMGKLISEEAGNDRGYQLRLSETAANIAGTLRFSDTLSTDRLLADFSLLERVLQTDEIYCAMDLPSRRAYAAICDGIARRLSVSQVAVAREAQKLTKGEHIGKCLIDERGRLELIKALGGNPRPENKSMRLALFITAEGVLALLLAAVLGNGILFLSLLTLLPAFIFIHKLLIRLKCLIKKPAPVPRLEIKNTSPEKVITAVSVLLTDEKSLTESMAKLETHYLSGGLKNAYYAIVGDFPDSKSDGMTDDEQRLISSAKEKIAALNKKYANDEPIFFCFMRKRELNRSDGIYMGRERKRGAIADLFRLLRSDSEAAVSPYELITDKPPRGIKYALLLDSDTVMIKNTLSKLMGAALHPLNRAEIKNNKIVRGYGIFVPRMERLAGYRTEFMRTHSGNGGVTPYSSLVSDFYYDNFGEAVFGGKGLVDIDAFCACTEGRIDDNTVLSHDMLESCMTRSAYLSDVILYDSEPATLFSWWKRQHRWIRGDWQLLPYLFAGKSHRKRLNSLSRYKIFDNLRSSLNPIVITVVLWFIPFFGFSGYAYMALAAAFSDAIISTGIALYSSILGRRAAYRELGAAWVREFFDFMSVPFAAATTFDAIWRTLCRLLFSHKKMLEWQTAAQCEKHKNPGLMRYYVRMWECVVFGIRLLIYPLFGYYGSLILGLLFLYAPFAMHLSDIELSEEKLPDDLKEYYTRLAYDIWSFFKNEAPEEMGFIPPDNVQIYPYMPSVHNSSPTNMGMGIMAAVSAYDLKFIDEDTLIHRLEITVEKIQSLDKWNGHLYNWYDTKSGIRLEPAYVSTVDSGNLCACLLCAAQLLNEIDTEHSRAVACDMRRIACDMDFAALYDDEKNLFHIGYDVTRCVLTEAWYDLLASEARLTYLVACALDAIPQKAWFSMGRVLTKCNDSRILLSWSGTMFEYLMPVIFTGLTSSTLIEETCKAAVDEHIKCSGGKPWGISESGYYAFDRSMYYQYRAFGAESLGLSPMTADEDVRAPYACELAAMIYPEKAYKNLLQFERIGARGEYGFFEAVDYTPSRVQDGNECEIVRSFMAHHQGMSICALNNILNDSIISKRFSSLPEIRTVILYNAEQLPTSALVLRSNERMILRDEDTGNSLRKPAVYTASGRYPRGSFLTNGRLTALLTDSFISYIKLNDIYITRFRRDFIRGSYGLNLYLRCGDDIYCISTHDGEAAPASQSFTFDSFSVEAETKAACFTAKTECIILQNSDLLCIKISIANHDLREKQFELGAFAELSLASIQDYEAHPAFVRLTVDAWRDNNMLCFRRRGTANRRDVYMRAALHNGDNCVFCSDGMLSPGRKTSYVQAMKKTIYNDLRIKTPIEPMLTIRNEFAVNPGGSRDFMLIIGAGHDDTALKKSMEEATELDFPAQRSLSFAMEMSSMHFMGISAGKARLFSSMLIRLSCGIKSTHTAYAASVLKRDALYKFGISGDLPVVLVSINSPTQFRLLKSLLSFLRFANFKHEKLDLVIIGSYSMSYRCDIRSYITDILTTLMMSGINKDQIHLVDEYELSDEEKKLLVQCTDIFIDSSRALGKQFADEPQPKSSYKFISQHDTEPSVIRGGSFTADGEYVIELKRNESTPLPWSNIICNPQNEAMGTLVTESGGGYTWYGSCHDMRLTPWHCDALHDTQGEIVLLTDDSGNVRSICHGRLQGNSAVKIRHGFGYTVFENDDALCNARMTVFTDISAPQKLTLLELSNPTDKPIKLSLRYIIDRSDLRGAHSEFSDGLAYITDIMHKNAVYATVKNADSVRFSGDREGELLLYDEKSCSNSDGFICLICDVSISAHEKRDLVLILGMTNINNAPRLVRNINAGSANEKLAAVKSAWAEKLNGLTVKTPDNDFDLMVNGRLLYQVYSSRLMSRTGFYQSGGAIGFRDQLQDVLALLMTDPERVKGQILLCASMQYEAGDVMHWWHMPSRGVRTKISDDRLFLPFVCAEYARVTGDYGIFDLRVPYLEDTEIPQGRSDIYYNAKYSEKDGTVYEHCMAAVKSACKFGRHGLPLMGSGDWNDGMDEVGRNGGESVFMGFFLTVVMEKLARIATKRNDADGCVFIRNTVQALRQALEAHSWDGEWYRRAYYGDGTPLGSKDNDVCRIDLLSQAWGVFAERKRNADKCARAMQSVKELLRDESSGIIKLLTPAFNASGAHNAGYIESYAEGVRENGGQYTHAAIWYLIAQCYTESDEEVMKTLNMLNPVKKDISRYMAEPYVMAADVYSCEGYEGRGGWTWYTGSAAWMYVAAVRYVLGLSKRGDVLSIEPHNTWSEYDICYRYKSAVYNIHIERTQASHTAIITDGIPCDEIQLCDDGREHNVLCYIKYAQ